MSNTTAIYTPTADSEDTSSGTYSITNRPNAYGNDGLFTGTAGTGTSYWGIWTGFGVGTNGADSAFVTGSTILGIRFTITAKRTGPMAGNLISSKPVKAGAITGTDQGGVTLTTTSTPYTLGSTSNLWGTTWTYSEITASGFGVALQVGATGMGAGVIEVMIVDVTYTPPAGGGLFVCSRELTGLVTSGPFFGNPIG